MMGENTHDVYVHVYIYTYAYMWHVYTYTRAMHHARVYVYTREIFNREIYCVIARLWKLWNKTHARAKFARAKRKRMRKIYAIVLAPYGSRMVLLTYNAEFRMKLSVAGTQLDHDREHKKRNSYSPLQYLFPFFISLLSLSLPPFTLMPYVGRARPCSVFLSEYSHSACSDSTSGTAQW